MTAATINTVAVLYKDMYPSPGSRLKQWVVDQRRESEWERETCPRVHVESHEDNTGCECRNHGDEPWLFVMDHDCCSTCNDVGEAAQDRADVARWLVERAARPPIEPDRTKYSDEIQPEIRLDGNPMLRMLPRRP